MSWQKELHLDAKDMAILRELDKDYRKSFSSIGKKVGLSKNSVSLRFERLRGLTLHNLVGIDQKKLGFTEVRVYYSFDYYGNETEKEIIQELKKYKYVLWAARFYGSYDLIVCYLIDNVTDLIEETSRFHIRFADRINQKHKHLVVRKCYFRYNFLHEKPISTHYKVEHTKNPIKISSTDKSILKIIQNNPRIHLIDIAEQAGLTIKTVSTRIKDLERQRIITGYFMTLDTTLFNHTAFKLLIQVNSLEDEKTFEEYLVSLKNVKLFLRHSGEWDYEIDFLYPSIRELQNQIEEIKRKYPDLIKKFSIVSFGGRIYTNEEPMFL